MKRGFTLVELLVVIGIIAVLAALFFPVLVATRDAVKKSSASRSLSQIGLATTIYMTDHGDRFPPAMYTRADGTWVCWFGSQDPQTGEFSGKGGLLESYTGGTLAGDPTHLAQPFIGDMSGFGYNYGHIGSDFRETGNWQGFPNCRNPAFSTELERPSDTVVYATSIYYYASWLPGGDGIKYDFAFFDPPDAWIGVPNIDFRHQGTESVDYEAKEWNQTGKAVIAFSDGHIGAFEREEAETLTYSRRAEPE